MFNNSYVNKVYSDLSNRYPHEKEFLQAAYEILKSLEVIVNKRPEIEKNNLTEYHKILSSLTPSDYKPYSIKEVNDEYLTRLKDIIFKAFTEINNYNFTNEENN